MYSLHRHPVLERCGLSYSSLKYFTMCKSTELMRLLGNKVKFKKLKIISRYMTLVFDFWPLSQLHIYLYSYFIIGPCMLILFFDMKTLVKPRNSFTPSVQEERSRCKREDRKNIRGGVLFQLKLLQCRHLPSYHLFPSLQCHWVFRKLYIFLEGVDKCSLTDSVLPAKTVPYLNIGNQYLYTLTSHIAGCYTFIVFPGQSLVAIAEKHTTVPSAGLF